MGDTPVGSTWDRCVLLTTDLRHHSNNRRAVMKFQNAGHDDTPTLGPYECGVASLPSVHLPQSVTVWLPKARRTSALAVVIGGPSLLKPGISVSGSGF